MKRRHGPPRQQPPAHGDGRTQRGTRDRLTPEQRLRLIALVAEFVPPLEICKRLGREFNIVPPHESLVLWYRASPKWRPFIEKARDALVRRIRDIGIANKVFRLAILDRELRTARHWRETGETRSGRTIVKRDTSAIHSFLRLAAEEMGELKQQVEVGPVEHVFRIIEETPRRTRARR